MWEDPIVAEVRQVRLEIEKECGGKFNEIYARAAELQKEFADRLVSRSVNSSREESTAELETV